MIWDKLIDRCLLFTDAPAGLLKELLKEAEQELSNKLELYDSIYGITIPNTLQGLGLYSHQTASDNSYIKLPPEFIRDIMVTYKGVPLQKMEEGDFIRMTNSQMTRGTPTAYAIAGDFIVFNTEPNQGDSLNLHYKSSLGDQQTDKVFTLIHYSVVSGSNNDLIWIDTPLGDKLDGYLIRWESVLRTLSSGTNTSFGTQVPGLPDKYQGNKTLNVAGTVDYGATNKGSRYNINQDFGDTDVVVTSAAFPNEPADAIGSMLRVINYRTLAPVIPDRFHTELCDYAIALANAKAAPDTYARHWTMWESKMERLIEEAANRDLIHTIREEM